MSCNKEHRSIASHRVESPKGRRYRCDSCLKLFRWNKSTSSWLGVLECPKCGRADVTAVVCSDSCRTRLEAERKEAGRKAHKKPRTKPRKKRVPPRLNVPKRCWSCGTWEAFTRLVSASPRFFRIHGQAPPGPNQSGRLVCADDRECMRRNRMNMDSDVPTQWSVGGLKGDWVL